MSPRSKNKPIDNHKIVKPLLPLIIPLPCTWATNLHLHLPNEDNTNPKENNAPDLAQVQEEGLLEAKAEIDAPGIEGLRIAAGPTLTIATTNENSIAIVDLTTIFQESRRIRKRHILRQKYVLSSKRSIKFNIGRMQER